MQNATTKNMSRTRRHARIRAKVAGTPERPRLVVYKSNRYLHAQIIDDSKGTTLIAGTTQPSKLNAKAAKVTKSDGAVLLGQQLAERAKAAGITSVVFDRGGFRYTGSIAKLADAARKGGLEF